MQHTRCLRGVAQLVRLGQVRAKGPLAHDMLACAQCLEDHRVVRRHADTHIDDVDIGVLDHRRDVIEGEGYVEVPRSATSGVEVVRAHRDDLELGQRSQRRQMGPCPPAVAQRVGGRHVRPDDANSDPIARHHVPVRCSECRRYVRGRS